MVRLVAAIMILGIACLGLVLYVQLDAPVVRVLVTGQLNDAERSQIQDTVRQNLDGGLLSADLSGLKLGILALSWPREVTIRRSFPDSLTIDIEKPAMIARWRDAYLTSDGSVVHLPGTELALPKFDCQLSEPVEAMEVYHRLSEAASPYGLVISGLQENEFGEWSLMLREAGRSDSDRSLMLGADALKERLDRFLVVYRQRLFDRWAEIALVDARYDNGVAVSWRSDVEGGLVAVAGTEFKVDRL